jgi:hypothetical protein
VSALGDRLRRLAGRNAPSFSDQDAPADRGFKNGLVLAAGTADEAEAVALANTAEGRGPHAALALRWAAGRLDGLGVADEAAVALDEWAGEAEESPRG